MGKAEEYLAKKRNKAARKRLNNTVDFTHGIQAAKRRRKAGRRRICEGMCYSLPTPDDPYNDLYQERLGKGKAKKGREDEEDEVPAKPGSKKYLKMEVNGKYKNKTRAQRATENTLSDKPINKTTSTRRKSVSVRLSQRPEAKGSEESLDSLTLDGRATGEFSDHIVRSRPKGMFYGESGIRLEKVIWRPSSERCSKENGVWTSVRGDAFEEALCALLNASMLVDPQNENYDSNEINMERKKVTVGSKWDWLFWEACGSGSDVLATGRITDTSTQTGCVLAAIAHITARRVHDIVCSNPVVLFVVQSKEQTLQVRTICKVLKSLLGLHAVSLHTGTPLQHQIEGLSGTSPEILIATPDRLCDLLSVNAVSISNVTFMVVDGLEDMVSCGFGDQLEQIRSTVEANVQTVVLSGAISHTSRDVCQKILKDPICKVESGTCMLRCSACISQNVHVLVSEERRLQKLLKIMRAHFESQQSGATFRGVLVLFRQSQALLHVKASLQEEGYSVEHFLGDTTSENQPTRLVLEQFRNGQVEVLLSTEEFVGQIDIAAVGTIVNFEFPSTMDLYCQTLMRMARDTINGMLYSFCSGATAPLALQLVKVLQQCLQPVPSSLRMLAEAATVIEQLP